MCFDLERFVDQKVAGMLICSICQDVLCCPQINESKPLSKQEPINGNKGGHKFCEKCITDWLNQNQTCPDCRDPLQKNNLQVLDRFASTMLKGLQIHCKYYKLGCNFIDSLELIERHELNTCEFGFKKCINCDTVTAYNQQHKDADCIKRLVELNRIKENDILTKDRTIEFLYEDFHKLNNTFKLKLEDKDKEIKLLNTELNKLQSKLTDRDEEIKYLNRELTKKPQANPPIEAVKIKPTAVATVNVVKPQASYSFLQGLNFFNKTAPTNKEIPNNSTKPDPSLGKTLADLCNSHENHFYRVKRLIEQNTDVNFKDNNNFGRTALINASERGHLDIVKILIQRGAKINEKSDDGWTALFQAAQNGHLDIVKVLIENGADVNEKDKDGWTALMLTNDGTIKQYLRLNGARNNN